MNFPRNTTLSWLFLAILFSFLTVVGSGSVAVGDLLVAPKGLGGLRNADEVTDFLRAKCFARDTVVSTETGLRPIGEISVGEKVHSFDFESGEWKLRTVTDRIDNTYEGPVVTVTTDESTIETTIHHPFWVLDGHELADRPTPRKFADDEDQNQSLAGRWVNSHELLVGDVIIGKDGRHHAITGISQRHEDAFPVSNLTIGEFHNYTVGPTSILVHNESICADGEAWLRNLLDRGRTDFDEVSQFVKGFDNADEVLRSLAISTKQLEKKWKHAVDFGITTSKRNPTTLGQFRSAILSHLDDSDTIVHGTYGWVADSVVHFNPNTNIVVVLDKSGDFISGWRLQPGTPQFIKFINEGFLH